MKSKIRQRLPEIAIEAFSVLLAVFLALAVDQWRENRTREKRADLARTRIEAELKHNIRELEKTIPLHEKLLINLDAGLKAIESKEEISEVGVNFTVPVLSDSAWVAAKATDVLNSMDFDWVSGITEIYQQQELCRESQSEVLRFMSSLNDDSEKKSEEIIGGVRARIGIVYELQTGLLKSLKKATPEKKRSQPKEK